MTSQLPRNSAALLGQEAPPAWPAGPSSLTAGSPSTISIDPGTQPVGVTRAAAELVVTRHQVAAVDPGGLTHGAEHAGVDAQLGPNMASTASSAV